MEELKSWTLKCMSDFLRATMEPSIIQQMGFFILNIENADEARQELEQFLGVEIDDFSQSSLLLRSHKLNFIDSYIEKRFSIHTKKKQKPVKVDFSKKNMEKVQRELLGPGFTGKRMCYCMAREHDLIGNCLACGKIICAVEGRGACLFCGHQVVAKGETPVSLPDKSSLIQAVQHKNKLLEYDRNTEERLAVIDDQNDWYDIADNTWLSTEDREAARAMALSQKQRADEAERLITLSVDFQNKSALADVGSKQVIEASKKENTEKAAKFFTQASRNIPVNTSMTQESRAIYESIMEKLKPGGEIQQKKKPDGFMIIQNEDPFTNLLVENVKPLTFDNFVFSEADDKRQCLTMHQPWASLLILGFKRIEGREWSTDFRGPLWIHASAKKPADADIAAVEGACKEYYERIKVKTPEFPQAYPTGVLIGRVELVDVMPSEVYCRKVEESRREESGSKFQFVIKNPMRLLVPIRMQGSKKIYSLDFDTWDGAKHGLRRVCTNWE